MSDTFITETEDEEFDLDIPGEDELISDNTDF